MNEKMSKYRWQIVALLFFATTINYIDRQVLSILAPQLQKLFNWTEKDYGLIVSSFQTAYAIGLVLSGRLIDRIGTRKGYSLAILIWSLAGLLHATARSIFSFSLFRFLLGLGESANNPAALKTVSEWFPKKERAFAIGIYNSGTGIGPIIAPLVIPFIALNFGWRMAFVPTFALAITWIFLWWTLYKKPSDHQKISKAELDYIQQDGPESTENVPWLSILFHKQTFGIALSLFITAPIWWFFLYWLPKFLYSNLNLDLKSLAVPLIIVYVVSDIGSLSCGWISSFLVKKGKEPIKTRKSVIFFLALLVIPINFASTTQNLSIAILLIAMATFAHQGYAVNVFALISDVYPKNAVGSVMGFVLCAGAVGGILYSYLVGVILDITHSYGILFGIASGAYILSWIMLKIFVPDNTKVILLKKDV